RRNIGFGGALKAADPSSGCIHGTATAIRIEGWPKAVYAFWRAFINHNSLTQVRIGISSIEAAGSAHDLDGGPNARGAPIRSIPMHRGTRRGFGVRRSWKSAGAWSWRRHAGGILRNRLRSG